MPGVTGSNVNHTRGLWVARWAGPRTQSNKSDVAQHAWVRMWAECARMERTEPVVPQLSRECLRHDGVGRVLETDHGGHREFEHRWASAMAMAGRSLCARTGDSRRRWKRAMMLGHVTGGTCHSEVLWSVTCHSGVLWSVTCHATWRDLSRPER